MDGANKRTLAWAAVGLLAASVVFGSRVGSGGRVASSEAVARVRRGTLETRLVERGTLVAPRSVTIASDIQSNRAKVIRLAPEGSLVKKGDLLVEFDAAPFAEEVTKFSRAVKEAEANLDQARADAALLQGKSAQTVQDAEMRARLAEIDLRTLEEGSAPLTVREAKARLDQADEQLLQASQAAADADEFLKQGFVTRKEYEEAHARLSEARRSRALAAAQHENLLKYRQPAEIERTRAALDRSKQEVARLKDSSTHERVRQEALAAKAEMALEAARADLARAEADVARLKVLAPADGFLVYDEIPMGSEYRRIQIGDSVWQGQPIMTIPDTSEMAVETAVREFDVHRLRAGQRAGVMLDAFPDLRLAGVVDFIGNLASERASGRDEKHFEVRIRLDATDPLLRPGMTAEVEIELGKTTDALLVPIEAIYEREGRRLCVVQSGRGFVDREITVGDSNDDFVAVVAGLEEGDVVSLAPRVTR
jgi:HlyD family secretion protein